MSNDNYILQLQGLDTERSKPTIKSSVLGTKDEAYKIQVGFPFIKSKAPFTFSISPTVIDFGTLSPTNPVTRTNTLTISNGSANGYSLIVSQDKPLSASRSATFIPDTTCDNGSCSEDSSAPWTNTLTYGFGYRCDNISGSTCVSGFREASFYKQFPDSSKSEKIQRVAGGTIENMNKIIQITYKVNISRSQENGSYQNIITYIAIPNF